MRTDNHLQQRNLAVAGWIIRSYGFAGALSYTCTVANESRAGILYKVAIALYSDDFHCTIDLWGKLVVLVSLLV